MTEARWIRIGLVAALWTAIGVVFAAQAYIGAANAQSPLAWSNAAAIGLTAWCARGALSPIVILLARRLPITQPAIVRRLVIHAALGLAWAVLATIAIDVVGPRIVGPAVQATWPADLYVSLLTYVVLVGLTQGAEYVQRDAYREITASRLEARLATARFDLLRMQLSPHFLASALHDVAELMHRDVNRAQHMVADLAELVRLALRHAGEAEVPLSEEVGFLRRYLQLEQMRSHDRLETRLDIDSDVLGARVPYLILQPLVESAVRHGAAPRVDRGHVEVRGRADGEALVLEVYDDRARAGSPTGEKDESAELRSARERLRESYGESHRLELTDLESGRHCVRLELPLRRSAPSPPTVPPKAQPGL